MQAVRRHPVDQTPRLPAEASLQATRSTALRADPGPAFPGCGVHALRGIRSAAGGRPAERNRAASMKTAPAAVVEKERQSLADLKQEKVKLEKIKEAYE